MKLALFNLAYDIVTIVDLDLQVLPREGEVLIIKNVPFYVTKVLHREDFIEMRLYPVVDFEAYNIKWDEYEKVDFDCFMENCRVPSLD